ncbi:Major cell-surface adhesin PAc-like, partial [Homarus americanus]
HTPTPIHAHTSPHPPTHAHSRPHPPTHALRPPVLTHCPSPPTPPTQSTPTSPPTHALTPTPTSPPTRPLPHPPTHTPTHAPALTSTPTPSTTLTHPPATPRPPRPLHAIPGWLSASVSVHHYDKHYDPQYQYGRNNCLTRFSGVIVQPGLDLVIGHPSALHLRVQTNSFLSLTQPLRNSVLDTTTSLTCLGTVYEVESYTVSFLTPPAVNLGCSCPTRWSVLQFDVHLSPSVEDGRRDVSIVFLILTSLKRFHGLAINVGLSCMVGSDGRCCRSIPGNEDTLQKETFRVTRSPPGSSPLCEVN